MYALVSENTSDLSSPSKNSRSCIKIFRWSLFISSLVCEYQPHSVILAMNGDVVNPYILEVDLESHCMRSGHHRAILHSYRDDVPQTISSLVCTILLECQSSS